MKALELLEDLADLGIRLEAHGEQLWYYPQSSVTPDLLVRLKAHKAELLAVLGHEQAAPDAMGTDGWHEDCIDPSELDQCFVCGSLNGWKSAAEDLFGLVTGRWRCIHCNPPKMPTHVAATLAPRNATEGTGTVCKCGSTSWRDVPIHDGQSTRRDCGRCGRFLDFPIWYGKNALQNEH